MLILPAIMMLSLIIILGCDIKSTNSEGIQLRFIDAHFRVKKTSLPENLLSEFEILQKRSQEARRKKFDINEHLKSLSKSFKEFKERDPYE